MPVTTLGDLNRLDAPTLATLTTTGAAAVGGDLTVTGDTTFTGNTTFTGSRRSLSAVSANGDTLTVQASLHAGKVVKFGKTTGTIVTLPAATGTGNVYHFVISVTATSNANIIKVANATDVMNGSVCLQQDTDSAGSLKMWLAAVGDDTITLAGAATTGGIVGATIRLTDYATGFWSAQVFASSGGGAEATPFSATVS